MVPTPCRVRRKLSFSRFDSQKTLPMCPSTESLGSVDKKAMRLNRGKTVDNLSSKTPKDSPSTTSLGSSDATQQAPAQTHATSQSSSEQTPSPSSKTPKGKTAKVKKEIRSAKKQSTAAESPAALGQCKKREVETVERIQQAHRGKQGSNQDPGSEKCSQEQQQRCTSQEHPEALDSVEAHYSHPINN